MRSQVSESVRASGLGRKGALGTTVKVCSIYCFRVQIVAGRAGVWFCEVF